jgi:hypothetical protein
MWRSGQSARAQRGVLTVAAVVVVALAALTFVAALADTFG